MRQSTKISDELLYKCLAAISGTDAIVVGGQALAYWADYFDIDFFVAESGITKDLDVLGDRSHLLQMSLELKARAQIQNPRFISALIGTIEIPISEDLASNIDVIHTVVGIDRDEIRKNAIKVEVLNFNFNVMHPIHVLESRLKNIVKIPEKRNEQGINQIILAVKVVKRYISSKLDNAEQAVALKAIEKVVGFAKISAGKMAADFGINLIDAIPFDKVKNDRFQEIRKPQIIKELTHLKERINVITTKPE